MPDLSRRQLVAYVVAGIVVVLAGARWVRSSNVPSAASRATPPTAAHGSAATGVDLGSTSGGAVVVHVAGEVRRPGVYRLHSGDRVVSAVRRAGGPTRHADLDALNLAAKVEDGRQVIVPRVGASAAGASVVTAGGAGAPTPPTPPVNLNTASAEQLATLDGIGPAMAAKIIEYRQQHGGFRSVDELDQVSGIGAKRLAALRDHVTT